MNAPIPAQLSMGDVLAIHRTRMASERTLMGWVRTALSMITFGFTLYKFVQYVVGESPGKMVTRAHRIENVAVALVSIGVLSLVFACFERWQFIRALAPTPGGRSRAGAWDLSLSVASLIGLGGLLVLLDFLFRVGPF